MADKKNRIHQHLSFPRVVESCEDCFELVLSYNADKAIKNRLQVTDRLVASKQGKPKISSPKRSPSDAINQPSTRKEKAANSISLPLSVTLIVARTMEYLLNNEHGEITLAAVESKKPNHKKKLTFRIKVGTSYQTFVTVEEQEIMDEWWAMVAHSLLKEDWLSDPHNP